MKKYVFSYFYCDFLKVFFFSLLTSFYSLFYGKDYFLKKIWFWNFHYWTDRLKDISVEVIKVKLSGKGEQWYP